jgi:hypothetical protein
MAVAAVAGLLVAVNRHLWWESVHGLANTLYAALFVALAYALTWTAHSYGRYWLAVLAGLITLTRYEGAAALPIVVGTLGAAVRGRAPALARAALPLFVLLAMPFLLWPLSGAVGVRTWSDLTGDSGLYLAFSAGDWRNNLRAFREFWAQSWLFLPQLGEPKISFLLGLLVGAAGGLASRYRFRFFPYVTAVLPYLATAAMLFVLVDGSGRLWEWLLNTLSFLIGLGAAAAVWRRPRWSVPLLLMLLLQLVVVTAILPKTRYYLPLLPFAGIALTLALAVLSRSQQRGRAGFLVLGSLLIMLIYTDARLALPGLRSEYNEKSHDHTVAVAAARYLTAHAGTVVVVERSHLPLVVYLGPERVLVVPEDIATPRAQAAYLTEHPVDYVFETEAQPFFADFIAEQRLDATLVQEFSTPPAATIARLYQVTLSGP